MSRPTKRALKPPAARPILQPMGHQSPGGVQFQQSVVNATKESRADPHSRGRAVFVKFTGNTTPPTWPQTKAFSHGLGRKPVGVVPRKGMSGAGALTVQVGEMTSRLITVTALLSTSAELWVY